MFDRLAEIAKKMDARLHDESFAEKLQQYKKVKRQNELKILGIYIALPDPDYYEMSAVKAGFEKKDCELDGSPYDLYFKLLTCASECNMKAELVELLAVKEYDINRLAEYQRPGKSLLGTAAYHGHLDLVKYLVEEKKADVNASASSCRDMPLHQVVEGANDIDHKWTFGNQHAEIARYLIAHNALLEVRNQRGETVLGVAEKRSLSSWESCFGRSATGPSMYATETGRIVEAATAEFRNKKAPGTCSCFFLCQAHCLKCHWCQAWVIGFKKLNPLTQA